MTNDNRHVLLSSKRHDYLTPHWFLNLVRKVGPIGFDPCNHPSNPTKAQLFCDQTMVNGVVQCGLSMEWPELQPGTQNFSNPPYGPHLDGSIDSDCEHWRDGELVGVGRGWAEKIVQSDQMSTVLVPVRSETVWWKKLWKWSDIALLWSSEEYGSRISFVLPETGEEKRGSNLASTVFFRSGLRGGPITVDVAKRRFREVFGPHGELIVKG